MFQITTQMTRLAAHGSAHKQVHKGEEQGKGMRIDGE